VAQLGTAQDWKSCSR